MPGRRTIAKSQLRTDLSALGVAEGQVVMLHASVKSVGWVVGGPDTIIRAILELLTPSGTLMMLASWEDNPYDLAHWPEERQRKYLDECPAFDPATSRADHRQMSILAEYLRTWPGACRSDHPLGSCVAVGARAAWITRDHPLNYENGPGSPLAKLCEAGGYVLLLGPLLRNITLLHHAEHLAQVPNKRIDRYRMPIIRDGKRVWVEIEEFDTTRGIVDWPEDYFETIAKEYLASGKGRSGKVGGAQSYLFDGAELTAFGVKWMEEHFVEREDGRGI